MRCNAVPHFRSKLHCLCLLIQTLSLWQRAMHLVLNSMFDDMPTGAPAWQACQGMQL